MPAKAKKFKFITIKPTTEKFNNITFYQIFNNKYENVLGIIFYYKPWKQYIFRSDEDSIYSVGCMKDIISYMEDLNKRKD